MEYSVFNTVMGWMAIVGSGRGLVRISLPRNSIQESLESLGGIIENATSSPSGFKDLKERLNAYFSGDKVLFPDELDLSTGTRFQKVVWQSARLIPYGESRSYSWLAQEVGKCGGARAVGQALGKNRLPIIIPCHRIIGSDGSLCGFNGGLEMKKRLLQLETAASSPQL
jgi:methylated-DNA-[protein]-cysteine S-methyltransferase